MSREIRALSSDIEIRSIGEEDEKRNVIVGYALRFNTYSEDLGGFTETIESGALDNADMSDVVALINHDRSLVMGRSTSETLKLEVDEFGLKYTIDPPDTTYARDLLESMKRGDISQSSFAFSLDYSDDDSESWEHNEIKDKYIRTIKRFKALHDVSIVTVPAYSDTPVTVAKRSLDDYKSELQNQLTKQKLSIELDLI